MSAMTDQMVKTLNVDPKAASGTREATDNPSQAQASLQFGQGKGRISKRMSPADLVSLQRTIGNRAVNQLLKKQQTPQSDNPAIQRTIIAGDNPGEYTDEDTSDEYAFIMASAETKKLEAIYQQKINDLEELKKSVLQKAFAGELKKKLVTV